MYDKPKRTEVISRPMVGEDCAALDLGGDLCVVTTDPITGSDDQTGFLGVNIACNDLASAGAEPLGLMVTILAPVGTEIEELENIMKQLKEASEIVNADIIGGHTEITDAVNRMVLSVTAIGKVKKGKLITTQGAKPGDDIILTNYAATEGTVILSYFFEDEFKREFGNEFVEESKRLLKNISVVKEGLLAATYGVTSMHDVTEGGVLGALWEISNASGYGVEVEINKIPILEHTRRICSFLKIDPLKLISSGCMIITTPNGNGLLQKLQQNDVKASIIGKITFSKECIIKDGDNHIKINIPESDELYKARSMKGLI
ncbi:MAG: AIR synthase [Clostridiaceae bacterium]|nr:AIR synthase [Clostridiaceae bacterium]